MMTKTRIILAVVVAGLLLTAVAIYYFSGWSGINCWTREVDINSGRTRYTRYWFWMATKQEISPTWMSELLSEADEGSTPDWHLVVTLSPGRRHSPHYLFHGAIAELDTAQKVIELYDIPRERRLALAQAVRDSWNRTRRYGEAGELISQLFEEALDGEHPKK